MSGKAQLLVLIRALIAMYKVVRHRCELRQVWLGSHENDWHLIPGHLSFGLDIQTTHAGKWHTRYKASWERLDASAATTPGT